MWKSFSQIGGINTGVVTNLCFEVLNELVQAGIHIAGDTFFFNNSVKGMVIMAYRKMNLQK